MNRNHDDHRAIHVAAAPGVVAAAVPGVYNDDRIRTGVSAHGPRSNNPLDDPARMELTRQEHQWALAVKEAIKQDEDLEPISDFWCAQLAIKDEGNVAAALDRAHHLQGFRQEYGIKETTESGLHVMTNFVKLLPGFHLALSYCADTDNYVGKTTSTNSRKVGY